MKLMNILVTGGAGYIGSVTTDHLIKAGHQVTVLDNLSHGYREAVPAEAEMVEGDIHDRDLLRLVFTKGFDAIMHFAALIEAGESMKEPEKYFDNNVVGSQVLFTEAMAAGINRVIFSSTAAVYAGKEELLEETDPIGPVNVYGQTKRMMEEILSWYHQTKGLNGCIFRYFNAAGASRLDSPPIRGEAHQPETHIIPNILEVAVGRKPDFTLFGDDYETPDGTCIRDYIHVDDLARAHVLGLEALTAEKFNFEIFNLGNGMGFSNKEVLETARQVTGQPIPVTVAKRRPGDAARLIASSDKARHSLGFEPEHRELETIIESAWKWISK
jgi:UDP-glucose 4-epimerase